MSGHGPWRIGIAERKSRALSSSYGVGRSMEKDRQESPRECMHVNTPNRLARAVFRSALLWGLLAALAFYAPLRAGVWHHPMVERYFMGHWVEYVETVLFCVGMAALVLKALGVIAQAQSLHDPLVYSDGAPRPAQELLQALRGLPEDRRSGLLANRLREALEAVVRRGTADRLDQDLQWLAEADAARAQAGYALVRIIVWAIPILGFLGTVIGITLAIASLSPQALEESLPAVTGGLGTAFDTTALALALSMVLMFVQFVVERMEGRLLARVDALAPERLASLIEPVERGDAHTGAVRRMAEAVVKASERLVQRQAELWQASLEAAQERWARMADTSREQLEAALAAALRSSLEGHARTLAEQAQAAADRERLAVLRLEETVASQTQALAAQQAELVRQGEVLLKVVEATGQVQRLEDALNTNLASLAATQQLSETLVSLAAAVQLLNARLGQLLAAPQVEIKSHLKSKAA
jgi:biopolymer transport protein ExbB/TolQ